VRSEALSLRRAASQHSQGMHLHHRRIAYPLLTGIWNERPYEIAPFFEHGSLAHLIQRDGPLKLSSAELILRQLVEGLSALHRAGIQHRDLKPSNILIESETPLEVVLTDFGSSALATMTLLTRCGLLLLMRLRRPSPACIPGRAIIGRSGSS
jgi:serine/threonine protein kinase